MPSEVYTYMADADLGAIIAYLKQAPPVDREVPVTRFHALGQRSRSGPLNVLVARNRARRVGQRGRAAVTADAAKHWPASPAAMVPGHGLPGTGRRAAGPAARIHHAAGSG
jgi:hypothetical protein